VGPGTSRGDGHRSLVTPERVVSEYNEDLIYDLSNLTELVSTACHQLSRLSDQTPDLLTHSKCKMRKHSIIEAIIWISVIKS